MDAMHLLIILLPAFSLAAAAGCARVPRQPAPAGLAREQGEVPLRYGGVYRSEGLEMEVIGERIFPMRYFLRFYPDGRVIEISTTGEMNDLELFSAENGLTVGTVTIRDGVLSFSIPDHRGQVDYSGEVRGDRLHLRIHFHADGKRTERVYGFVPAAASIPPPP